MANALLNRRPLDYEDYQEDTPGLMSKLGSTALSGLSRVSNFIDLATGASSIRDALAGENPFDQFMPGHWTTSDNRVSGRELLRKHGLIGDTDTWGNFAGGMA